MEAEIILTYNEEREAKAVARAISPDNVETPLNLHVKTISSSKMVITYITYDGNRLKTFISTIDDLLSCVSVAERSFSAVKKVK